MENQLYSKATTSLKACCTPTTMFLTYLITEVIRESCVGFRVEETKKAYKLYIQPSNTYKIKEHLWLELIKSEGKYSMTNQYAKEKSNGYTPLYFHEISLYLNRDQLRIKLTSCEEALSLITKENKLGYLLKELKNFDLRTEEKILETVAALKEVKASYSKNPIVFPACLTLIDLVWAKLNTSLFDVDYYFNEDRSDIYFFLRIDTLGNIEVNNKEEIKNILYLFKNSDLLINYFDTHKDNYDEFMRYWEIVNPLATWIEAFKSVHNLSYAKIDKRLNRLLSLRELAEIYNIEINMDKIAKMEDKELDDFMRGFCLEIIYNIENYPVILISNLFENVPNQLLNI